MLSREEMRQVERSLANNEQDTRDEIGFLLIHQGFADRFFPGTSVLHERIRYALFVPWLCTCAPPKIPVAAVTLSQLFAICSLSWPFGSR